MTEVASAVMFLIAGNSLDGWVTLSGQWAVRDGVMSCEAAPASIRSTWESNHFILSFQYRHAGRGTNRLAVHSKMSTGGSVLLLNPRGVYEPDSASAGTSQKLQDKWIDVRIELADGQLVATSTGPAGTNEVSARTDPGSRGFLRFQATEPGLEIRDLRVTEPGFVPMFTGDTLDGWESVRPKDPDVPGWVAEQGVIRCEGHRSSWLRTLQAYDDFVLRLEYQLPPRGNSGIFVRAPIEGRVSRIGLEVQLLDDVPYRGRIKPAQHTGSVYDGIAPEVQVPAPVDQWNAIEVRLEGNRIRTTLNGVELYDTTLDNTEKDTNSHRRPLATRRVIGFIGLQDHSTTVRFRHVRIRTLP